MFSDLPVLGLGASLSLGTTPDPVALVAEKTGPGFIEYSGLLDVSRIHAQVERIKQAGIPVLFHPSYINFAGSFNNSEKWLKKTQQHIDAVGSPWFAQDCAYCFWQNGFGYASQFGYFIPPILNEASLELAVERVKEVQKNISVPVAIEPPPVTFVVGCMPVFEFFGRLAESCDCALLLDVGHLVSYEMATGQSILLGLEYINTQRVIELHIAGGKIKSTADGLVYIDAHELDIMDESWKMLSLILPYLTNVKAICYECEGVDAQTVLNVLDRLRNVIKHECKSSALVRQVELNYVDA